MLYRNNTRAELSFLVSRLAHMVERSGLAMVGAICGTFVAAYLAKANIDPFDSISFIASMILVGMIGFYLGVGIPRLRARHIKLGAKRSLPQWDTVELLSATGTFLAAVAALTSVYAIVFDEPPQGLWEFVIVSWWLLGVTMQIGAGVIGRCTRVLPSSRPSEPLRARAGTQNHQRWSGE
jgi:hypothetical protein